MTATAQYPQNPTFTQFRDAIKAQFEVLKTLGELYTVDLSKDDLYQFYLDSYPEGTNQVYRTRLEYDGSHDKSFIRSAGRVVAIHNGKLVSVWDVQIGGYYQVVADAMKEMVQGAAIKDRFFHFDPNCGLESNLELDQETGKTKTWRHFHVKLPAAVVKDGSQIPALRGELRTNYEMLSRSLKDFTVDAADTILDLIAQDSLYKGAEKKHIVEAFLKAKRAYEKTPVDQRELFCWKESEKLGEKGRFRGDVIGTLLGDLSEGKDLEAAVASFESKVDSTNYKRTTALITPAMVKSAQEKVVALGLQDSLARRFAVTSDLTINNVLFADRTAKAQMNVFDQLTADTKTAPKKLDKIEEISIADFIKNVLPKADSLELLVENRLQPNLVSLVAPANEGAPNLFKWDNGFSWSYNGEVTDSIKERVKAAGGSVTGDLRVSLSWFNSDDLDLWIYEPTGGKIYHGNKVGHSKGTLDLDMNAYGKSDAHNPVENVTWARESEITEGEYRIVVNNYNKRMSDRVGFDIQMEFKGQVFSFGHPQALGNSKNVEVARFKYSRAKGVEILSSIGHTKSSQDAWGIKTETFQKVALVLNSPNFWDDQTIGNQHFFFMLEGCKNPESTRGFYNEYLREELHEHRKVFEMLAGKLKADFTEDQLSGLGFSVTKRNEAVVKVSGSFNRTLKIKF
ncbi:hypothetical protein Hena1_01870 [Erwinia phage Hena1]|uniref:Uncharacterized protein n=1 Tax=Erwinia phage Hena1 TaxID=2678601 RepID=A0A6B9JIF2_9CAUD|nr:hypothetical protein HWC84_gp177 [Erwinia phage Hena1]QGZ16337.1 hypothetical protein Hena1_01870 [Erwinia phage Hena1]